MVGDKCELEMSRTGSFHTAEVMSFPAQVEVKVNPKCADFIMIIGNFCLAKLFSFPRVFERDLLSLKA